VAVSERKVKAAAAITVRRSRPKELFIVRSSVVSLLRFFFVLVGFSSFLIVFPRLYHRAR
jgi:hypothetical protein